MRTRTMKVMTVLLASAALAIGGQIGGAALAQVPADTVDLSIPTQLPRTAVPSRYALTVTPHADKLTFDGSVAIDLQVTKATDTLVLNAVDLDLSKATLTGADGTAMPGKVTLDEATQTASLDFGKTLQPGAYKLAIDYSGKINTQANGLFALDYKNPAGAQKRAIFTQFEPADARRFVPSWDEPDYKAVWQVSAIVPAGEMAVNNMPAAKTEPMAGGLKRVTFQPTPQMSSYLLFFGTGDFGRVKKMAGNTGVEVGIVMGRGNEAKARTALDAEAQILPYYNEYFGVPYPLPKLDNVAGPGQSQFFSAMENWGSIFTFERVLLDDPEVTTEGERHAIFGVEAHEMAHQWFGDLVTMAWWDDLWLNEGFASWMATKATKHFHPDWGAEFNSIGAREGAMGQDSLTTTHPIVQQVRTVEQANQAFDGITYSKGQSVITMLEGYAGSDVWQKGIQTYIKAHAYRNTRTDDLWKAVEAAGATGLTQMAHDFTLQPGVPLIRIGEARCQDGQTVATLVQDEYSVDRKPGSFQPLSWHVPVRASVVGGKATTAITQGRETQLTVPGCGPLLLNVGQTGYYRSLYQPAGTQKLLSAFTTLDPLDQYGLVEDQSSLSYANYQPMSVALDFNAAIPLNARPELISLGLGNWNGLYGLFDEDEATQNKVGAIIEKRYAPVLAQIGLVPQDGEKPTVTTLRPQLIGSLGRIGDPGVTAEAKRLFAAMQTDPNAIPGGLKRTWLGLIAINADADTWEKLHVMARNASSATERQNLYSLLGAAKDEALARKALDLALTDEPGKTVSAGIIGAVSGRHPELALDFVLSHWPQVEKFVDATSQSRFVARIASGSDELETIAKLESYAKEHIAASARKPIDQSINVIRVRLEREPRIKKQVAEWLAHHPA
ncbi:MAG TPA: M1 family metallopeptidase [Sphingomicrobium sp.]|nr:M1 family metallopeptidase [Sphingomicrobium sp.]